MFKQFRPIEFTTIAPLMVTLAFVLMIAQYSFHQVESVFYDAWIRYDFLGNKMKSPIVVVVMDEASNQFLGEDFYPYTYASHLRLMTRLTEEKPHIVGYMLALQEANTEVETRYQSEFYRKVKEFDPTGDKFKFATEGDYSTGEMMPPENIKQLGFRLGIIHKDQQAFAKDDVVRKAILNVRGEDSIHLWIAKRYRESKGLPFLDATHYLGADYNNAADANFVYFKYAGNPALENIPVIPFHRVVAGNFPKGFFKDKIVLVGPQYLANADDFVFTPFSKESNQTPKIMLHAQIIDSFIQGRTIFDIKEIYSKVLSVLVAIILSIVISRFHPVKGLLITVNFIIITILVCYLSFVFFGWWFKLAHLIFNVFVVYYIWVPFRAIEEYQTRYAFQEETKLLKQVDNLKQNFISLMSHDLKTPVAKIAGIADILKMKFSNTTEQLDLIENISNSTKELNNFINSILDLTKIESQNLTLKKESKDINNIIESIVKKLEFEANSKQMGIETELSPLYPIQIDVVLMNRVISNLIENAIKYAGKGKTIWVKTWDDAEFVYIEIKDNGLGIGPEDLQHIFDKFYRVKNDSTHAIKGSGLGLYLVKYFIELHNGNITANSKLGEGTSFIIKLKNE